jgi:hypothetical protein
VNADSCSAFPTRCRLSAAPCDSYFQAVKFKSGSKPSGLSPSTRWYQDVAREVFRTRTIQDFARVRYQPDGDEIVAKIQQLKQKFWVLVVDTGLVYRLDDFISFAMSRQGQDPWLVRESFSNSLGTTTFYRGMNLDPNALKIIESKGVQSSFMIRTLH